MKTYLHTHYDASGHALIREDFDFPHDLYSRNPVIIRHTGDGAISARQRAANIAACQVLLPGAQPRILPAAVTLVVVTEATTGYRAKYRIRDLSAQPITLIGPIGSEIEGQRYAARFIPFSPWQASDRKGKPFLMLSEPLPADLGPERERELMIDMAQQCRRLLPPSLSDRRIAVAGCETRMAVAAKWTEPASRRTVAKPVRPKDITDSNLVESGVTGAFHATKPVRVARKGRRG